MKISQIILSALAASFLASCAGTHIEPKADALLTAMSSKLKSAQTLRASGTRKMDASLVPGAKAMESVNFTLALSRPNKINATTKGAAGSRRLIADGQNVTLVDVTRNLYSTVTAAGGTTDEIADSLEANFGFSPPLAEFLGANPKASLLEGVTDCTVLNNKLVNGTACNGVAFTQKGMKWKLWIGETDSLPQRIEIVYTGRAGAPKYEANIMKWELGAAVNASEFTFTPSEGAQKIEMIPAKH